jgi:class 3 adenylate cyclase
MDELPIVESKRGMSLKLKLTIGLILIIGILFAGLNTFTILDHGRRQKEEALIHNETVARIIAASITPELATHDIRSESFRSFATNLLSASLAAARNRDLAYAVIIDNDSRVVAGKARPRLVTFPSGITPTDEASTLAEIARLQGRLGGYMRGHRFPLVVKGLGPVGKLLVGTSTARIERQAERDFAIGLGLLLAALVALVVYATLALNRMVVRPVTQIANAMRAVQQGDLRHEVDLKRGDEIGVLATTYNFMVRGLKEREQLKDAFSRYVSSQVYDRFREGAINLRGETRKAVVFFSDIRSFTTLSEQLTPVEVVAMLNEYFTEMVEIVFKHDGFVNKFIGDAIMAIYNVPLDQPDPELRAVRTGLEMLQALEKLNARRAGRQQFAIKIGIGINTGPVVAGNLGHERRLEYTVIGDTVNLAQRIESQTKVTGTPLLISHSTYTACASQITAQQLPPVKVKGKAEPVVLYSVTGLASEWRQNTGTQLAHALNAAAVAGRR